MPLLLTALFLILYWVAAVYSVSIHESFTYSLKFLDHTTNYFYFGRHLINLLVAWVVAFIVSRVPLRFVKQYKGAIFLGLLVFQLLVFTPLGIELQGARWWLRIPWYGTIQPSEFFKLWFVTFFAWWLYRKKAMLQYVPGYVSFLAFMWIIWALFLKIPDLGTMLVLWLVGFVMYRYAWGRARHLALIIIWWLVLWVGVGWQIPYVKSRLSYFVNSSTDQRGRGVGYQTEQALLSVGAWWVLGNGYGKGLQKFGYIPEAQSDFIFAAFSEEVWFFGALLLFAAYGYMAYLFLRELPKIKDEYTRIFGVGIIATIMIQVFVNVWVNIKILPLTGLTLPFISTGGTALMVNFIQVMMLYKIIYKKERIT
jgi:cell division protein FtsW (lipid II flippase)